LTATATAPNSPSTPVCTPCATVLPSTNSTMTVSSFGAKNY
jgi:hypothetical protein